MQNGLGQPAHLHENRGQSFMRDLKELNLNEGGKPVPWPRPTAEQVREFEERFGVRLPDEYLSLLRYSNGGHPEKDSFRPAGATEDVLWGVNRFYHLTDDHTDLEGLWRATEEWQSVIGKKLVPVANDAGGNQLVLAFDRHPPSVKICIHDENFRLLHVADTFGEFIDLLVRDPDMI